MIIKMSWPSVIAMLAMSVYNFIDAFWLARLSSQALAALTVCFPIQMIFAAIGIGSGIGAGSYCARMFGAGKMLKAQQAAGQVFLLSLCFGIFMILAIWFFHDPILIFFGATTEIMPLCRQYIVIIVLSSPFLFFSMMTNNLLRAEGRPLLSMFVVLISAVTSAILDPFLIFGFGTFPALGIKGAALAAVIAQCAASIFSVYFMQLKSSKYDLQWQYLAPDWTIIKSIYQTGFPSMVTNLVVSLVLIIFNHVLGSYGSLPIAALGICFRINGLVTMILFGIGFGLMPIVGFSAGAKLHHRLRESVFASLKVSVTIAILATIVIEIFATELVRIFSQDAALIAITVPALRLYVSVLTLTAIIIIFINMFMGLGKGNLAMLLLLFRDTVLLIPLLIILPTWFGITGVWLAIPVSFVSSFMVILYFALKELKQFKKNAPKSGHF